MQEYDQSQLIRWFAAASFPASRAEVRKAAEHNGAPQDLLDRIDQFDDSHTYRGYSDVMVALGVLDYSPAASETKASRRAQSAGGPV